MGRLRANGRRQLDRLVVFLSHIQCAIASMECATGLLLLGLETKRRAFRARWRLQLVASAGEVVADMVVR